MENLLKILNENYSVSFERVELFRDMGGTSYIAFSGACKYFLRVIKAAFLHTAATGADIQVF